MKETPVVTTIVAVDPATAFAIFTEEIDRWWKPRVPRMFCKDHAGSLRFETGGSGRLVEVHGDGVTEIGKILVWSPPERLVFGWREADFGAGETTEVEVRFERVVRGTRVTVEHRGWERLPADHVSRRGYTGDAFRSMIGLRWADLVVTFRLACSERSGAQATIT